MVTNLSDQAKKTTSNLNWNMDELWEKCLLFIKERIQEQAYQTWFDGVSVIGLTVEGITLQVPNQFHYEWLESKYRHLIDNALKEYVQHPLIVHYSVVISDKQIDNIPTLTSKDKPVPRSYHRKSQLNLRYIFQNRIKMVPNLSPREVQIFSPS